MQRLNINCPMWKPVPSVGIGEDYQTDMEITISYTKANGEKLYPHTYFIEWERLKYYQPKKFKPGMPAVRIVPITMLEVKQ